MVKRRILFVSKYMPFVASSLPWLLGILALTTYKFGPQFERDFIPEDRTNADWASIFASVSIIFSLANILVLLCALCLLGFERRITIPASANILYILVVIAFFSPSLALCFISYLFVGAIFWGMAIWITRRK